MRESQSSYLLIVKKKTSVKLAVNAHTENNNIYTEKYLYVYKYIFIELL